MAQVVKNPRDGGWMARWRDPGGHQRKKSFARRADAQQWLDQQLSAMHRGQYVDPRAGEIRLDELAQTWSQGLGHLKESTGPVASVRESDGNVFINVGRDYPEPDRFVIVLWNAGVAPDLGDRPEWWKVCARGRVTLYDDVPQIQLEDPDASELDLTYVGDPDDVPQQYM